MKTIAAIALATLAANANATTVGIHTVTAHSASDLNGSNPGLYLRTDAGFTAGAFRNSYDRTSAYAGWTWETRNRRFALTAGAITGYPAARIMPLLAPSVRFGIGNDFAARLTLVPKPPKGGSGVGLHLSIERDLR